MDINGLKLKFDPRTLEHLGIKMYSQVPYALAELVANAYDAAAPSVNIFFYDNVSEKRIIIEDDGDGMSFDDVRDKFLVIGRPRRDEDVARTNSKNRVTIQVSKALLCKTENFHGILQGSTTRGNAVKDL